VSLFRYVKDVGIMLDCKLNLRNYIVYNFSFIRSFVSGSAVLLFGHSLFFSFIISLTRSVGLLGWVISMSQGRYLYTGQHKHRKTRTHTSMPWVGNPRSQLSREQRRRSHSDRHTSFNFKNVRFVCLHYFPFRLLIFSRFLRCPRAASSWKRVCRLEFNVIDW
jgi:hypothetical protein